MAISKAGWIVIIVAVVAAAGVFTLLSEGMLGEGDISGQAIAKTGIKTTSTKTTLKSTLTTTSHYCTDSDNGLNELTKGTTKGEVLNQFDEVKTYTDECETSEFYLEEFCTSEECVKDYYCETDKSILQSTQETYGAIRPGWISCAQGYACSSGACVQSADFSVDDASIYIYPQDGNKAKIDVIVRNGGVKDTALDDFYVDLEWTYEGGGGAGKGELITVSEVIPSGSTSVISGETTMNSQWIAETIANSAGKKLTVTITLDYDNTLPETDESNNGKTRIMTISYASDEEIILS